MFSIFKNKVFIPWLPVIKSKIRMDCTS